MLLGIAGAFGFLALVVVIRVLKHEDLVIADLDVGLEPVAEGLAALGPGAGALADQVRALGFELVGVFRVAPRTPRETPSPLRTVRLIAYLISPDRTIGAGVTTVSVLYEKRSARNANALDVLAFGS